MMLYHIIVCRLFKMVLSAEQQPVQVTREAVRLLVEISPLRHLRVGQSGFPSVPGATQKAYLAGKKRYLDFCQCSDFQLVPIAEENLR